MLLCIHIHVQVCVHIVSIVLFDFRFYKGFFKTSIHTCLHRIKLCQKSREQIRSVPYLGQYT